VQDLASHVVLITGAGSGIGRATALAFANAGATLLLAGRRVPPLEQTAALASERGVPVSVRSVDLEDGDAAAALGAWALDQAGRVDVLVNNAGHSTRVRSIRHVAPDEFASVFRVNVEGVYRLTQSLLESMIARGGGTVITVASRAALNPSLLGGIPYGAAKAAEVALMKGMVAELRGHGIRACTVIPGEVNTPVLDARPSPPDEAARATMMQPEDVAEAILLCARLPARTLVEQIVMLPTQPRDQGAELAAAAAKHTP
jgi:NADP-dependent 3-hydroxy acid dehydrogenase YdfG